MVQYRQQVPFDEKSHFHLYSRHTLNREEQAEANQQEQLFLQSDSHM